MRPMVERSFTQRGQARHDNNATPCNVLERELLAQ